MDVKNKISNTPESFKLSQNYPNPFNQTATLQYTLPNTREHSVNTVLKVFDILGENQRQNPGDSKVIFTASSLASSVFYYRLRAGDFIQTKKMMMRK